MPTILFANTKGGAGKTTATLVFASHLQEKGARVIIMEGDKNRPHAIWASERGVPVLTPEDAKGQFGPQEAERLIEEAGRTSNLIVINDNSEERIFDWLDAAGAWANFVLADPEGTANGWLADVAGQADLVVIPTSPKSLDVRELNKTIALVVRAGRRAKVDIPYVALLSRTSPVQTRPERLIRNLWREGSMPHLPVTLQERPGFEAMFQFNKTLGELTDKEANGLPGARKNAAEFSEAILEVLRSNSAARQIEVAA